jgi:hypothetical protein
MLNKSALQRIFLLLHDKKQHQLHQEIIELFIVDRTAFTLFSKGSNVGDPPFFDVVYLYSFFPLCRWHGLLVSAGVGGGKTK